MAELTANQFAEFFELVHSKPDEPKRPFEWQMRLAEQVLGEKGWPDVIRVPTSSGKTSVLDIALFELASHAGRESEKRTTARRICFVIDRRLVVDEVSEHARSLYDAISLAAQGKRNEPVLKSVADALASLAADKNEPLRVVRLRGAVYRDDGWAADPLTPTILISTVDQIGSRLLFRGYGVSRRSRPLQAGLLAFDNRIILDEAHLSTAFAETVSRVQYYQQWAEESPLPRERLVSIVCLSATVGDGQQVFELSEEERQDDRLKPRLEASKPAELVPVQVESITKDVRQKQPRKARELERENHDKLVKQLVSKADQFTADGPAVIGVVVNRVATARQVFEQLRQKKEGQPEREALLLTGRIRPYDRDRLLRQWLPKIKAGRDTNPGRLLFVVATQTVEVGANIDFDALVTEASPLDALRQRFGRLHRLPDKPASRPPASAAILIRSDQKSNSETDPIYGQSIAETWKWMNKKENIQTQGRGKVKRTFLNFGINLLDPKLPKTPEEMQPLLAAQPKAPLLFPAHLDAWVQTNPIPDPDPDVGPFLHGPADAAADVQVIWRADLDEKASKSWPDIVRLMPPRIREALPVPVYQLREWLKGAKESAGDIADLEGVRPPSGGDRNKWGRRVLRWRGTKDARVVGANKIMPGDTVIVPASYGGADKFGWMPESKDDVLDVAESCLAQLVASYPPNAFRKPKLRLRLHILLLKALRVDKPTQIKLEALLHTALAVSEEDEKSRWEAVKALLSVLKEHVTEPSEPSHRAAIDAFLTLTQPPRISLYRGSDGLVISAGVQVNLSEASGARVEVEDIEHEEPEDDEASLAPFGRQVLLADHTHDVKSCAEESATRCGLQKFRKAFVLAGQWHDEGKRDARFQAWLHGSELKALAALASGRPLAKSGRDLHEWGRADAFGYPRGMRHEFVSVRLLEKAEKEQSDPECYDIARLLIGTHHGFGRAFAPVTIDRTPVQVSLNQEGKTIQVCSDHRLYCLDSDWIELFWRMVRRYGWWGLAYLESVLITADHAASAQEQERPAIEEGADA